MSTFTIKFAAGYDAPWFVAEGDPQSIKQQLIEFFDLKEAEELSPNEVALKAVVEAQALAAASLSLAAVPEKRGNWPSKSDGKWKGNSKPKEPAHPFAGVLESIKAADSREDLIRIWTGLPQDAKDNADVKAAFKQKGDSFS